MGAPVCVIGRRARCRGGADGTRVTTVRAGRQFIARRPLLFQPELKAVLLFQLIQLKEVSMIIHFIQTMFPHAYQSADFIAVLLAMILLSTALFTVTRYTGWLICMCAGLAYLAPVIFLIR
jgi:hypothetical protein